MLTSILIVLVIILIVLALAVTDANKSFRVLDAKIEKSNSELSRYYGALFNNQILNKDEILKKIKSLEENKWVSSVSEAAHIGQSVFAQRNDIAKEGINDVRRELRHLKDDIFMDKNGISKFCCYKCTKELGFFNILDYGKHEAPLFCSLECCKK